MQGRSIKKAKTVHGSKKDAQIELAKSVAELQNGNIHEISEKIFNNVSKQNNQ